MPVCLGSLRQEYMFQWAKQCCKLRGTARRTSRHLNRVRDYMSTPGSGKLSKRGRSSCLFRIDKFHRLCNVSGKNPNLSILHTAISIPSVNPEVIRVSSVKSKGWSIPPFRHNRGKGGDVCIAGLDRHVADHRKRKKAN